jgi:hypothetical protein
MINTSTLISHTSIMATLLLILAQLIGKRSQVNILSQVNSNQLGLYSLLTMKVNSSFIFGPHLSTQKPTMLEKFQ